MDWLLQSESGPVGETWVRKIKIPQLTAKRHCVSFPLETASEITCRSGKDLCASGEREFQRCRVREGDVDGSPVVGGGGPG